MKTVQPQSPEGLSPEQVLFLALEDPLTARFLRSAFKIPEHRPEIVTKRWLHKAGGCLSWHVVIIEKPGPSLKARPPLLNIAHIMVDGLEGKVLQRWFLQRVSYKEYREFMRQEFSLRKDCTDRSQ